MSDPITIIGANTVVSGNLEGDEDLTIEGRVEGSVTLSRTLTIEINGVVHANINVRNAIISGVLVGNVEAQETVHVTEEGRVVGDISAPRVILVDGASFRGSIDMGDFDIDRGAASSSVSLPAKEPVRRATPTHQREPVEEVVEEAPRRAPVRRPAPVAKRPAARSAGVRRARPAPAKSKAQPKPSPAKAKRSKAPKPKVRAVGKAKATKKRR